MAIKCFCRIPTIQGYTPRGFEVSVDFELYNSDPMESALGKAEITVSVGTPPEAVFLYVYQKILARLEELEWPPVTSADIFAYVPMSFSQILPP